MNYWQKQYFEARDRIHQLEMKEHDARRDLLQLVSQLSSRLRKTRDILKRLPKFRWVERAQVERAVQALEGD